MTLAGQLLKNILGGLAIPILLFAIFVFWAFDVATGFSSSPLWLPYLLSNACVVCLYLAAGLYKGIKVPASDRRFGEIFLSMWEHMLTAIFISSILTLMFYFLLDFLQLGPTWILELFIVLIGACAGVIYTAMKLSPLIQPLRNSRKQANYKHERPIVMQQQMRRTPWR